MPRQLLAIILCICLFLPLSTQQIRDDSSNQQNYKAVNNFISNEKYNNDIRNPGKNTTGIALFATGIVVCVLLIVGLIIGTILLIRWRRKKRKYYVMDEEKRSKSDEEKSGQEKRGQKQEGGAEAINNKIEHPATEQGGEAICVDEIDLSATAEENDVPSAMQSNIIEEPAVTSNEIGVPSSMRSNNIEEPTVNSREIGVPSSMRSEM